MTNISRLAKSDYLKLFPILVVAFYVAFIPHQNYPYPVHLDEWQNFAHFQALLKAGSITYPDPYLGGTAPGYPNLEVGFHVLWIVFHQVSGVPWLAIFRYSAGVIFMMTVLSVYILAQRERFGWQSALFTCLLPTNVGILGPAFVVPVAIGLLFIPLSLFVAFNTRKWSYVVLFIFISLLLTVHATTAIALVIILVPYILLNIKSNYKHSLGMTLAVALSFLVLFPWISSFALRPTESLLSRTFLQPHILIPPVISSYGYLPSLFGLIGTFVLSIRGGEKSYGLILGLLALLQMLVIFFTFHYGVEMTYGRWLVDMMLMMSIVAGAGLAWMKNIKLPMALMARLKAPPITRNVGQVLCLALIVSTFYIAIPARQNTPYYHMIDQEDYEAFTWIRENIDSNYSKAILDPWKATAFTAVTGKSVYSRIGMAPGLSDIEAYGFLQGGSANTTFLRENLVSIIYTRVFDGNQDVEYDSDNRDLVEVRKDVYLLKE